MKTKKGKINLTILVLLVIFTNRTFSQIGTLQGTGHDCNLYSFNICPNQTITPLPPPPPNYQAYNDDCNHIPHIDVAFNILGSLWRVDRANWTFTSTCNGRITGYAPGGGGPLLTIPFGAAVIVSPNSYPGANGIAFNLNGILTGPTMDMNTFSIAINPSCGAIANNNFTCCANSTTCQLISPIFPPIGGPFTFTWMPGNTTGSSVCCPTVNTSFTVVATSSAGCTSTALVNVRVQNCPVPSCCIGNPCIANPIGTNPLASDWQVPLGNFNYVFTKNAAATGNVGIGAMLVPCTPGNLLDVSRGLVGPLSGLRLTDLRSPAIPLPSNGQVLSVNPLNGDVILTTTSSASALGGPCPSANLLTSPYEIPMNNWNFNFTTPPLSNKGQVLIGRPSCNSFSARLDVEDDFLGRGIYGFSSRQTGAPLGDNIGIHGNGTDAFIGSNVTSIGVLGEVNGLNSTSRFAGVAGFCGTPVLTALPGRPTAIYGNNGGVANNWGGYFDGDVGVNGNLLPTIACNWNVGLPVQPWNKMYSCNGFAQISDSRKKENVQPLNYGLKDIMRLKPISYTWINNPSEGRKIGFLAQELKEVINEVVSVGNDENKTMAVNYAELVSLLVKGMQEQQQQIDELKTLVQTSLTNTTSADGSRVSNSQAVSLTDKNAIVLNQNVPNPFAESTVIAYNIPTDFTKAQIIFSTNDGKIIKTVDITTKGAGTLSVFADDLTNGLYTYTLVVDGRTIDTKKMIKGN